jgi:hypothetical protein
MKKDSITTVQGKFKTPTNHKCDIKCFGSFKNEHI